MKNLSIFYPIYKIIVKRNFLPSTTSARLVLTIFFLGGGVVWGLNIYITPLTKITTPHHLLIQIRAATPQI